MLFILRQLRRSFFQPGKLRTYVDYAIGEILLIVLGILIAMQIGNWNENRLNKVEEQEILGRIIEELVVDKSILEGTINAIEQMIEALDKVEVVFEGEPVEDNYGFLSHVTKGAQMAWGQPDIRQSTYLELQNSGKFGLIRSVESRDAITSYYDNISQQKKRADSRVNVYGRIAYDLIHREPEQETVVKTGVSEDRYQEWVESVLGSELKNHIVPLRNRYQLISHKWKLIGEEADELIELINGELDL